MRAQLAEQGWRQARPGAEGTTPALPLRCACVAGDMFASAAARAPAVARSAGECSTSAPACLRASAGARRSVPPPPAALRRAGGSRTAAGRVGRSAAVATMTPSRRAESPSASPESSRAPPQPLLHAGACAVEEQALASALGTVVAHEAGTLKSRRLRYEACSPETLEQAYDRCGVVTEDYGRTFYMGAHHAARAPAARCARPRRPARIKQLELGPGVCGPALACRPAPRAAHAAAPAAAQPRS